MTWLSVGAKCVCVLPFGGGMWWDKNTAQTMLGPKNREECVITQVGFDPAEGPTIDLVGYPAHSDYAARYFRPLVSLDDDVALFAPLRSATDPTEIWVRPREEFEDGRFEALKGGQ